MVLSLRQRDQSERNFMNEIQRMQEDIKVRYYLFSILNLFSKYQIKNIDIFLRELNLFFITM